MNRAIVMAVLLVACTKSPNVPAAAQEPPAQPQTQTPAEAAGPRVTFPDGFVVHVEIAANDELRAQGLMYRDQLRPATGMLFLFPEAGEYPFWMKNTLIPLDMIWIDRDRKIVHVAHDVPPCKIENCPNYPPNAIALYVLEVAAGVAKQHGLKNGDLLRFEGTENVAVK
jgi:uncharacterized membrane protein (UPF0127 family)